MGHTGVEDECVSITECNSTALIREAKVVNHIIGVMATVAVLTDNTSQRIETVFSTWTFSMLSSPLTNPVMKAANKF